MYFELRNTSYGSEVVVQQPLAIVDYAKWSKVLYKIFIDIKADYALSRQPLELKFTFSEKSSFDPASAFTLARMIKSLTNTGIRINTATLPSEIQEHLKYRSLAPITPLRRSFHTMLVEEMGRGVLHFYKTASDLLEFFGYTLLKIYNLATLKDKFPFASFINQVEQIGLRGSPIIALISFLIGMVLSYQGIIQLSRFGAEVYTVDFLAIGVLRELGVLLTAIVVAGRSASSFTAQIGTMSLNQEIDAMRAMQLDPILYLVIPRFLALLVALPLLVFLANIMAFVGGMLTTQLVISMSPLQFINQLERALSVHHFWIGMSKAPLFAIVIAIVGCFRGMQVRESAENVGKMTTASVVEAIFLVIVVNAFMSILFSYMKV